MRVSRVISLGGVEVAMSPACRVVVCSKCKARNGMLQRDQNTAMLI